MSIKARRKGSSTRVWSNDPGKVKISARSANKGATPRVALSFYMPSKGGGWTDVEVSIESASFQTIVKAMGMADDTTILQAIGSFLSASPDATIKACGAILIDQAGLADSTARIETAPLLSFQTSAAVN